MNVETLTIPKEQAREKLRAVRKQLHRRADAEYEALEAAYEQAARGRPLVDVRQGIFDAPTDDKHRPRLAIARADKRQVQYAAWQGGAEFRGTPSTFRGRRAWMTTIRYEDARFNHGWIEGFALVPLIPAEHRGVHDLSKHHILWEVEQWSDKPLLALPDRDPFLLRHVHADLFAVIAEWDLTDIERAVMAGRAREDR